MVLHKYYRKEMIGAVFDVGRVSRFQCGLLHEGFSLIVLRRCYKRRGFVQSLMRKRVSRIQCGFLHQDYFLFTLHKCYKRRKLGSQEKKGCREEDLLNPSNNCYKITSFSCQTCEKIVYFNSLYLPHVYCLVKLMITYF